MTHSYTTSGDLTFNFYRFLARKDIVTLNLQKHNQAKHPALRKTVTSIFYIFKCLILYPVSVFFWFCVMAGFLFLLGRNQSTESIMLVAMGVVGAIRVSSYYNEALATDIAKILPFALLGIMIIDNSLLRIVNSTEGVRAAALLWETLVYYLVAVVVIEFILRMVTGIFGLITGRSKSSRQKEEKDADLVQDAPVPAPTTPQSRRPNRHGLLHSRLQPYGTGAADTRQLLLPACCLIQRWLTRYNRSSEDLDVPKWNVSRRREFVSSDVTPQHECPPRGQPGLV